jgi:hypothetical protein
VAEIGIIPLPESSPTVGFSPTRPHAADGERMEPSVSVPIPAAAKLAAIADPVPELDPEGERSRA